MVGLETHCACFSQNVLVDLADPHFLHIAAFIANQKLPAAMVMFTAAGDIGIHAFNPVHQPRLLQKIKGAVNRWRFRIFYKLAKSLKRRIRRYRLSCLYHDTQNLRPWLCKAQTAFFAVSDGVLDKGAAFITHPSIITPPSGYGKWNARIKNRA